MSNLEFIKYSIYIYTTHSQLTNWTDWINRRPIAGRRRPVRLPSARISSVHRARRRRFQRQIARRWSGGRGRRHDHGRRRRSGGRRRIAATAAASRRHAATMRRIRHRSYGRRGSAHRRLGVAFAFADGCRGRRRGRRRLLHGRRVGAGRHEPSVAGAVLASVHRVGPFFGVEKGLGKGVVLDLQRGHFFVLVRRDGDELGLRKRIGDHATRFAAVAHEVDAWLVFVQ